MDLEKRQSELEKLYNDLDQRKLVGIILELTIENIDLKKQLSIHGVVSSFKPLSKIERGDYVVCKLLHEQCKNSLTKGKRYEVVDINDHEYNRKLYFYIIDDNGKKKRYGDDNRQFEYVVA